MRSCKGRDCVNLATFEIHAGSLYKKPADFVFIVALGLSMKEMILLVQGEPL